MRYSYVDHVKTTLVLMSKSYNELEVLFRERGMDELKIVQSHLIKNYVISLHYVLFNEICKLLEVPGRRQNQNVASLEAWNEFQLSRHGTNFKNAYKNNQNALRDIRDSEIFRTVKTYRDTKFSHIDGSTNPLRFNAMKNEEMVSLKKILIKIKEVVDNLFEVDDQMFCYDHIDNRTDNFIRHQSRTRRFYRTNIRLAFDQGFFPNKTTD